MEIAPPPGSVLPVHETVTLRFETGTHELYQLALGMRPAEENWSEHVVAETDDWTIYDALADPVHGRELLVDQLVPVRVTGIVNVAPWHAFSEAFDMLAAPVSVV